MKNFLSGKICLNLVIIQKIQSFLMRKVIGKMKDEFGRVIVVEFAGLKSKMHSMKKIDGKECNTANGVSIKLSLMDSKMFCLMKKLLHIK